MRILTRYRWPGLLAMGLLLGAIGCAGNQPEKPKGDDKAAKVEKPAKDGNAGKGNQTAGSDKGTPSTVKAEPTVQPVKLAEFEQTIQKHKGKVVLVDFWFNG